MSLRIEERFTPKVLEYMRSSIEEAGGNEVLFSGKAGKDGVIDEILLAARGTEDAVPVIEAVTELGDVLIHNHPSGNLKPSQADLSIATELGDRGIGVYIIDNLATKIYPVAEIVKNTEIKPLDVDKTAAYLEEGGALSKSVDSYESRPGQIGFLKAVCGCFNKSDVTIAEAGTGVGKSFAYLIPAFKWAEQNKERVVISTGTINLQHQLLEKDIPVIKRLLGSKLKAALVKGRQNYICLRRYHDRAQEASLFDREGEFKALDDWLKTTKSGERSDMSFSTGGELWGDICSESESCLGIKCPYHDKCFVIKSRKDAAGASVIVVNHHLLFSDLSARTKPDFGGTSILPGYARVIFDEAHNMEDAATSYFSQSINKGVIGKILHQIYHRVKDRVYGVYQFWKYYTEQREKLESIPQQILEILAKADELEKIIQASTMFDAASGVIDMRSPGIDREAIYNGVSRLKDEINTLCGTVIDIHDELSKLSDKDVKNDNRMYETAIVMNKLIDCIAMLNDFSAPDDKCVSYIEKGRKYSSLFIAPISVADTLGDIVFKRLSSVVLVSATLSVNRSFEFFARRIGLHGTGRPVSRFIFESPFDYKNNVLLSIPKDLVDPNSGGYIEMLSEVIKNVLVTSKGRGLVLFTSYSMLKGVYDLVCDAFKDAGITLFKQNDTGNSRLLENFIADKGSVLFATVSFWEGIDVPGEALSVLVICRLPFSVPSDPVVKARMELIESRGGSSFMEYSLPAAVIKLRQGFGRLIRRKSDRGVVLITDTRVLTKSYGKILLNSLPETAMDITESDRICNRIEDFLYAAP